MGYPLVLWCPNGICYFDHKGILMIQQTQKGLGLSELRTDELEALLRLIYQGKLTCPFDRQQLMTMGFNRISEFGELLCHLDEKAVRAVLFAVLAERKVRSNR